MKKIILLFGLMISLGIKAQDNQDFDQKMNVITQRLDSIIKQKNNELKSAFKKIDKAVEEHQISKDEAEKKKKEIAKKYADDLDYIVFKLTSQIKDVVKRDAVVHKVILKQGNKEFSYTLRVFKNKEKKKSIKKHKKRTYGKWFISFGTNNILSDNKPENINDSPYGLWQSRYFSFGKEWKTSFSKKPGPIYFTYGLTYSWNTLKPMDNKYHMMRNDSIFLETYPNELSYSKLRTKWLTIPVGLELHLPNTRHGFLKIKAGGYAKFNVVSKQKLKLTSGNHKKIVDKGSYNINNFNYGFFGEVGGKNWSVVANYDLIHFFKTKNWNHFTLGLKLEL